jgi:magnesium chelatase family protein
MPPAPQNSQEIQLKSRPDGEPRDADFELVETPLAEPGSGELLVRNVYMSVDPYMRGRMRDVVSYVPPFALGELGLDGEVRAVRGVLPLVEAARRAGVDRVIVPRGNLAEARLVPGIESLGVRNLSEAWEVARGGSLPNRSDPSDPPGPRFVPAPTPGPDLSEIHGLLWARRVLEVAAAGRHGLLLEGPPGAGKSLLARCLPSILPDLGEEAALEVTRIRSAAGLLDSTERLSLRPPLRAPHHTASAAAVVGGGHPIRAGEVTLAHQGVLLLDEAPEFARNVLEALRQPVQDGSVTIARSDQVLRLPSRFQLVATRNPCPCGMDGSQSDSCLCTPVARDTYRNRLSGPLLDRIALVTWVDPVPASELLATAPGESSQTVRGRVNEADGILRSLQPSEKPGSSPLAEKLGHLTAPAREELEGLLRVTRCSTRAVTQMLDIGLTVAALAGRDIIQSADINEALLLNNPSRGTHAHNAALDQAQTTESDNARSPTHQVPSLNC